MRQIISVSLPPSLVKSIDEAIEAGEYTGKSDFFRSLARQWQEQWTLKQLKSSSDDIHKGKGITLSQLEKMV
jgi:Arc/MetJ-type ribon-helix-helix transcriptional regulator